MLRFLNRPNLPENDVKLLIIGEIYAEKLQLSRFGIRVLTIPADPELEGPVQAHTDMQAVHLYTDHFLFSPNSYCKVSLLYNRNLQFLNDNACKAELLYMQTVQGSTHKLGQYPESASYNVLILGDHAFYNPVCIDKTLEKLIKEHYSCISVRQGYARCACCIVQENAVITSDEGMKKALESCRIDVLHICPGFIDLPGYEFGFIGGASFKIGKEKLAFTGVLDHHPDKDRILGFLDKYDVQPVYLTGEPIFDIGSAVPVLETV